jgi:integrase
VSGAYQLHGEISAGKWPSSQCGFDAWPHRFRHHFSHTWLERAVRRDLMELNGWTSPQMQRP